MPDLLDVIRDEAKAAKADPALLPSFKALRLNMGVADIEAAMLLDASTWQRIEAPDRPQADGAYTLALRSRRRGGYECCGRLLAVHGSPRGGGGVPLRCLTLPSADSAMASAGSISIWRREAS